MYWTVCAASNLEEDFLILTVAYKACWILSTSWLKIIETGEGPQQLKALTMLPYIYALKPVVE